MPRSIARSIFYLQLSNILFAATAIFLGRLAGRFDGYFTSFVRFLVGTAFGFAQLAAMRRPFRIVRLKPWLGRGIFGAAGMILYYLSIGMGSPGRATLFNTSYPVFVALIAIFLLRSRVRITVLACIALSLAGVALVLWDGARSSLLADLAGLGSGILAGASYHFNKRASQTEDPIVIYLGVCFAGMLATAFSVPQFAQVDPGSALLLILAGLGGYFAQLAITVGLRDIDATRGSVHTFLKVPLTALAGWFFLSEKIGWRFLAGTILLLAGLFLDKLIPARGSPGAGVKLNARPE